MDVDPGCLAKAEERFSEAWARAEAKGGCATSGDEGAIEATVDACVAQIASALVTTTTIPCGVHGGVCGGSCPFPGAGCLAFGVGCFGEPEPCRCHGSTTTCSTSSTTSTTSTTLP